jgi:putative transposase
MSRPLRIEYPGAWYHVMNRGRRREQIFFSPKDYNTFISCMVEAVAGWNLNISAYCLMPNHYHLLVYTPEGNLSRGMRHINGVYTQRFNRTHKTEGQLFRGRYKAVLVEQDNHLLEVLRYIHRNPLKAGIAHDLKEFTWSSHRGYLSKTRKWNWLHKKFLLDMLTNTEHQYKSAYEDFIAQGESPEIEHFYSLKNLPFVLGGSSFKDWVRSRFRHLLHNSEIPESRNLAEAPEDIINLVCSYFRMDKDQIMASRRGHENLPRDLAIYLVRQHSRITLAAIGKHFAIDNYSTVSSAVERIKARRKTDTYMIKHLEKIEAKIDKSQKQTYPLVWSSGVLR